LSRLRFEVAVAGVVGFDLEAFAGLDTQQRFRPSQSKAYMRGLLARDALHGSLLSGLAVCGPFSGLLKTRPCSSTSGVASRPTDNLIAVPRSGITIAHARRNSPRAFPKSSREADNVQALRWLAAGTVLGGFWFPRSPWPQVLPAQDRKTHLPNGYVEDVSRMNPTRVAVVWDIPLEPAAAERQLQALLQTSARPGPADRHRGGPAYTGNRSSFAGL